MILRSIPRASATLWALLPHPKLDEWRSQRQNGVLKFTAKSSRPSRLISSAAMVLSSPPERSIIAFIIDRSHLNIFELAKFHEQYSSGICRLPGHRPRETDMEAFSTVLTRALPDSVRQQSTPCIEQAEVPECEHSICMGMVIPKIRHKAKLVDMKMNSPNDIDACHNLIFPYPF